eukprot:882625-Rhodomonas_salina.1
MPMSSCSWRGTVGVGTECNAIGRSFSTGYRSNGGAQTRRCDSASIHRNILSNIDDTLTGTESRNDDDRKRVTASAIGEAAMTVTRETAATY